MGPEDYNRLPVSRSRRLQARCNAAAATECTGTAFERILYNMCFTGPPARTAPGCVLALPRKPLLRDPEIEELSNLIVNNGRVIGSGCLRTSLVPRPPRTCIGALVLVPARVALSSLRILLTRGGPAAAKSSGILNYTRHNI